MSSQTELESSIVEEMLVFLKGNKVTDSVSAELQEKIFCPVFTTSGQRLSSGGGVRFHLVPAAAPRQP